MSFIIPSADALVTYIQNWTGSQDTTEIQQCIYQAELMMRNIELPQLRSNPYDPAFIGTADQYGAVQIPPDMNKPIVFFKQGSNPGGVASPTGPWIVYDRIGDRDMISQSLIAQLYLTPVNLPSVIRGKFSEVGGAYKFLPLVKQGDKINMYYYMAWPLLFTPIMNNGVQVGIVENNAVLSSFPEGYVYGTLHCYYTKRHSPDDAATYLQKFEDAWKRIEDQNNEGKWSGGHTRQYSVFQPRRATQYNIK